MIEVKPIRRYRTMSDDGKKLIHEQIIHLYLKEKLSVYEVARKLALNSGTVMHIIKKLDIPMRSKAASLRIYNHRKKRDKRQQEMKL